jgi:hypothetical protein
MYVFIRRIVLFAIFCVFFGSASPVFAGFGITPPYVRNDKLTQGSSFTQEIILVRGDPVEDLKAELTVSVPGIEDWITIDRGTEFLLPKGEKQVPMKVTIRVPQNAPYERHQGTIRIRTLSPDPASGVSIALGAQIDVDILVVDEIRDFDVKRVQISETEEPRRFWWLEYPGKITFTMGIENTGNAPTAPSRVELDIFDKRGNVVLEKTFNTNKVEEVLPFETRDVVAYLPTRLPPSAYLVKYSIYHYEDQVKRSGELTLSVLPQGTLNGYSGYGIEGLSFRDKLTIIIPVGVLLALLLITVVVVRIRHANRKTRNRQKQSRDEYDDDERKPPTQQRRRPAPAHVRPISHGVIDLSRKREQ